MTPWIMAIRPRTLPAAIAPVLLGNVIALPYPTFSWLIAAATMACALLLQMAVNLANDYFDFKHGVETAGRLGPVRVRQSGLLSPTKVRNAMLACLVLALLVGSVLIWHGGWPIALLAAASILAALGYSAGPYPLASNGLGEISAFLFFGIVALVGSFYLQTGIPFAAQAWLLGAAMGCFSAAIMLVNNTRDIAADARAGKHTLAVRLGAPHARVLYQALVFAPYALIIAGFLLGALPGWPVLLAGLTLVLGRRLSHDFRESTGAALNPQLARTAALMLLFSLLFCLGSLLQG